MSDLLELMKASLGPAVALMGVAVAAAQWHTNDVKLRLDSYDRRLRVYKATVAMLDSAVAEIRRRRVPSWRKSNKKPTLPYEELPEEVVKTFQDCLLEASFLFDREVTHTMHYIDREVRLVRMYAINLAKKEPSELLEKSGQTSLRELREAEARIEKLDKNIEKPFRRYLKLQRFQK
ncbi:hypothetical protein [Xanthomonas citri]|uniref:hypothetical protein n=1 Tax=Xanthomonas citri TaxID=346 RepID=UPI0004A7C04D|nr:hypothetical protein [Xanthomonas citri]QDS19377.1 hypothetical protein FPL05_06045 [Xanthomonas citri pv. glycines]QTK40149.1 hypothetical protein XcgCFBP7119R_05530 [Xanthomonas citri pv. glycines]